MSDSRKVVMGPVLGFDEAFGQRMAGDPPYRGGDSGSDFNDTRFAPLDTSGSGHGSRELKKFIQEQIAEKTEPTKVHVGDAQFSVYFKEGAWRAKGILDGEVHRLTGQTRDEVMGKLAKLSQEQARPIRKLNHSEEIEVARLCQSGRKAEGIARYLELRIGYERGSQYASPEQMTADPSLQGVMSECALFTWLNSRADVRDSDEFRKFVRDYAGSRPINHDILDAAWAAFLPYQEKQTTRTAVARLTAEPSAEEIEQGLEDMDDAELSRQFWQTAKFAARQ